jgi:hypothetical protein
MTNCCDDYGNCDQGRNCPIRHTGVAKVGRKMHASEMIIESLWRYRLKKLAYWMLMAILGLLWLGFLLAVTSCT